LLIVMTARIGKEVRANPHIHLNILTARNTVIPIKVTIGRSTENSSVINFADRNSPNPTITIQLNPTIIGLLLKLMSPTN